MNGTGNLAEALEFARRYATRTQTLEQTDVVASAKRDLEAIEQAAANFNHWAQFDTGAPLPPGDDDALVVRVSKDFALLMGRIAPGPTPTRAQRSAMATLLRLVAMCRGEVSLTANGHRSGYESVAEHLERFGAAERETPPETIREMEQADTVWCLQFYPDTPVGFIALYDSRPDRLLERGLAILTAERKRT